MPPSNIYKLGLCLLLTLAACQRAPVPQPAVPASAPEAALRQLAQHLHNNDLQAYAQAAVPAKTYAQLETAWREDRSRWPLTELPMDDQLQPLLATLAAPDAERTLLQGFKRNFANQHKDLKDAAHSLGQFGVQYVKREGVFTDEERAHYAQVIQALGEWAEKAPLGNPKLGNAAIAPLVAAARKTGLTTEQAFHDAGMGGSLQRLGPFFAQAKTTLASYDLPVDRSFAELRTELVEQKATQARVRVRYPLAGRQIDTVVSMERREGRWYVSDTLRHAEQALLSNSEEMPETLPPDLPAIPGTGQEQPKGK